MNPDTDLGKKLKQAREQAGLSQEELARMLGYQSRSSINKIEAGVQKPPLSTIKAFAKALGLSPNAIVGWQETSAAACASGCNLPRCRFGETLTQLRIRRGYSQKSLAEALDIGRSRLSMYETGQREPDLSTLVFISDFFGVSTDYLLGRDERASAPAAETPALHRLLSVARASPAKDINIAITVLRALRNEATDNER